MRAIVYTAPHELQELEVAEPQPEDGEVVVEVGAVGICGSEIEGFANQSPFRVPPLIMGHEFVGCLGDGSRVVVNPVVSCRRCDLCLRGLANLCRQRKIIGIHRSGGFAQRVAVPKENCYPLPEGVSMLAGAVVEPLANAVHAFRLAQQNEPNPLRVGVIGAGALGFLTAVVARDRGVPFVAIADLSEERRTLAVGTGASTIGEHLNDEFDVVFDAVGRPETRLASLEQLRPGGTAVWIGLHGPDPAFDALAFIRQEHRVLGTFCYQDRDYRAAIPQAATLNLDWIRTFPLSAGIDAFDKLVAGDVTSVKTVLLPNETSLGIHHTRRADGKQMRK